MTGKVKKPAPVAVAAGQQWHTAIRGFCRLVWHSAGWQREDIRKDIFYTEANSIIYKASQREICPVKAALGVISFTASHFFSQLLLTGQVVSG